jgi:hypothetical protein
MVQKKHILKSENKHAWIFGTFCSSHLKKSLIGRKKKEMNEE